MKHISAYLRHLKFDPKLSRGFIAKYITNLRLIILIVTAIVVFGTVSFTSLPRNLYPDIKIPMVIVTTVLPGANPQDVESLVTIPLEDSVTGLSNIDTIQSSSLESVSTISISFKTGVDPDKAKTDVQSAIDGVTTLPESAQKPNVMKIDFQKTPIWTFSLTADNKASLLRFSKRLKQELIDLPSIDNVTVGGLDEQEIQIIVKPDKISAYNVSPQQLIQAVKTALNTFPAGNVKTSSSTFSLTINPQIINADDIRLLKINLSGQTVSLSDIAEIIEKSKPDQYPTYNGSRKEGIKPSVSFSVFRVTTVNIDKANSDAQKLVTYTLKAENGRFKLLTVTNYAKLIQDQFSELTRDLIETIILVAIVLFLFLGARQAFVALLATPLTFLISFIVMNLTGISLSFISSFALLLSLGLLVDDTIVVISAITAYYRSGKFTPLQAGLLVWRDFIIAITTTTTTTVWAFLPILISAGIIGEFIKPIPIVVSSTLIGSFFVAVFITLPFILFLLKPSFPKRVVVLARILLILLTIILLLVFLPKNSLILLQILVFMSLLFVTFQIRHYIAAKLHKHFKFKFLKEHREKIADYMEYGVVSLQRVEYHYSRIIYGILSSGSARKKVMIMVIIFSIFSYLLVPLGFVKNEFFPKTDADTVSVSVELPSGTNLVTSKTEALKILNDLKETPETKFVLLNLGSGVGFFGSGPANQNNFLYTLILNDEKERKLSSSEIAEQLRKKYVNYSAGTFSVIEQSAGPPAGSDIQIKLFGPDLTVLDEYANKVEDYLKKQPGVTNVDKSIKQGTSKIVFVPNGEEMARYSLTPDTVGFWLRFFATGVKIDTIKLDNDLNTSEDITLRMGTLSPNAEDIGNVNIPTKDSGSVPLASLGSLVLKPNPTLITREDGKRTISVTAGVKKGYTIPAINSKLEIYAKDTLSLPPEYSWATGGANEENQKSVNSIYTAMLISILLIIITMVLQFSSFRRAFIVITVIPLSISGVFIIFALTQTALTFPALIGVLALFGIVVKNSILVVDKITANIRTGMEFTESIADAAASRLEPIALTSITAIVGLIPITLSDPLWRGLGGAIIAGLTFSGTIMLFFIPVVYYIIYNPYKGKASPKKRA
ncbi:MAG: efflux RND transporter permease subunit [Patescibacteria group bacterium]|nr:efflux RND transporter permease subunit [Patescibacteria group bacterium]